MPTPKFGLPDAGETLVAWAREIAGEEAAATIASELDRIRRPDGALAPSAIPKEATGSPAGVIGLLLAGELILVQVWAERGFGRSERKFVHRRIEEVHRASGLDAAVGWALDNATTPPRIDVLRDSLERGHASGVMSHGYLQQDLCKRLIQGGKSGWGSAAAQRDDVPAPAVDAVPASPHSIGPAPRFIPEQPVPQPSVRHRPETSSSAHAGVQHDAVESSALATEVGANNGNRRRGLVFGAALLVAVVAVVAIVWARSGPDYDTIALPHEPGAVAIDSTTHTMYVAHYKDNSVSVVDLAGRQVTTTIPVAEGPDGIAVDPSTQRVYVANLGARSLSVIDAANSYVTTTIGVNDGATGVAVDPGTQTVFVTGSESVAVVDGGNNTVIATIPVAPLPTSLAVDPITHKVFVGYGQGYRGGTEIKEQRVTVLDGLKHVALADIPVTGCPCWSLAVDPNTHRVFVALGDAGLGESVAMLDATSHELIKDIDMNTNSFSVALDPNRGLVYVTHGRPETSVMDSGSGDVLSTLPLHGKVAVDSSTGIAYVAEDEENTIVVVPEVSR